MQIKSYVNDNLENQELLTMDEDSRKDPLKVNEILVCSDYVNDITKSQTSTHQAKSTLAKTY
ncbi:MAG: hypothetical protein ACJ71K_11605 [Nitrososphaeraceae archaeon]